MIGDVLTSSILFECLRHKFPEAQLDYLINTHTYPVVKNNPFIDNFIFFTHKEDTSKIALYKLAKQVKKRKYNIIIDVYSKFSSNAITLLSSAKLKISKHKWYSSFIYSNTYIEANKPKTIAGLAIENRLQLLEPILGNKTQIIQPKIYLTKQEIDKAKLFLTTMKIDFYKPLFMISVLGSQENKTYPFDYMAKIIDKVVKNTGGQILFNYIPSQKEYATKILKLCTSETQKHILFNVFGKSLREFMAITKHCNALIGNEGGAVNIAKAMNISTFTIFSPWISKEAWNMFEDGKKHLSIHLKDVKPELYGEKTLKEIKKDYLAYYKAFTPELIIKSLNSFLSN
ncbi:heptosyltransferase-2 [Algibacter pectinivorans]|uniref:Heptosyltransferase-2 n=2 Tax=Algibacter pectinivorans TaxID=870482 RepID=A0A1I1RJP8_9FLAO|nr:heptosyltransferase-2 [Algibacter pectinivorans]